MYGVAAGLFGVNRGSGGSCAPQVAETGRGRKLHAVAGAEGGVTVNGNSRSGRKRVALNTDRGGSRAETAVSELYLYTKCIGCFYGYAAACGPVAPQVACKAGRFRKYRAVAGAEGGVAGNGNGRLGRYGKYGNRGGC